jgi:hypothetical protein
MKRRTLDILVSIGGLAIAALLVVAGIVLSANASFANNYVHDQLVQQNITFKTAETLTDEEKAQACLVTYAGQKMTTGKQAECYANNFIGLHLKGIANGQTYADLGAPQTALRNQLTEAQKATPVDQAKVADLQKQLADVTAQRETVFKGETLRGLLLTSYGFSELGAKAALAATVAYIGAGVLFLLALAGLIHAMVTPKSEAFAAVEPTTKRSPVAVS